MPKKDRPLTQKKFRRHFPLEMLLFSAVWGAIIGYLLDKETYLGQMNWSVLFELLMNIGKLTAAGLVFGAPACLSLLLLAIIFEYWPGLAFLKTILYLAVWFIGLYILGEWLWGIGLGNGNGVNWKLLLYLLMYGAPAVLWTLYRDPWQARILKISKKEKVDILDVDI